MSLYGWVALTELARQMCDTDSSMVRIKEYQPSQGDAEY